MSSPNYFNAAGNDEFSRMWDDTLGFGETTLDTSVVDQLLTSSPSGGVPCANNEPSAFNPDDLLAMALNAADLPELDLVKPEKEQMEQAEQAEQVDEASVQSPGLSLPYALLSAVKETENMVGDRDTAAKVKVEPVETVQPEAMETHVDDDAVDPLIVERDPPRGKKRVIKMESEKEEDPQELAPPSAKRPCLRANRRRSTASSSTVTTADEVASTPDFVPVSSSTSAGGKKKLYECDPFDDPVKERNRVNALNAKINRDKKKNEKAALVSQMSTLRRAYEAEARENQQLRALLAAHGVQVPKALAAGRKGRG